MIKKTRLLGEFIKKNREALNMSQRALGMVFSPAVTTQFISNVERGVTPLPPAHIPVLAKTFSVPESEITGLLEKEFAMKLNRRLGVQSVDSEEPADRHAPSGITAVGMTAVSVEREDFELMKRIYEAYRSADSQAKREFADLSERVLKLHKGHIP